MTMKTHYTEADLLETYYTQPGASMPVMMHLASCPECAARYDRLDRKLREAAACHTSLDESRWAAQRSAIMARVALPQTAQSLRRLAAAALLVLTIGGTAAWQVLRTPDAPQPVITETTTADPWESEELKEFGAVVEWETWIEEKPL
jgi:hypothetical protein